MNAVWKVNQTELAILDYAGIIRWTAERFGSNQARIYKKTINLALRALRVGPDALGVKRRDELPAGVLLLHVARQGRKGRHFIVFRVADESTLDVLRILYDGMDLAKHLPD